MAKRTSLPEASMLKLRDPQTLISDMLEIMTAIFATQIEIDAGGVAWLAGTKVKVVEVALDKLAHGWSPEEIHFQHPHLSLSQIHGALTYYYENQAALDAQMARTQQESMALAMELSDPAFQQRLSDLKRAR